MELTIRPLGPQNATHYLNYLETIDFHHAPDWSGCFCRFYHTECSSEAWQKRSAQTNKQDALESIQNGSMKGYLAYHDDLVVGWVNANAIDSYVRLTDFVKPYVASPKTGGLVCFVIHPQYRHQGVAKALLKAAVEGFKSDGFEAVLAFPFESQDAPEKAYRGSRSMYEALGFEVLEAREDMAVLRKDLTR